MLRAKGNRQFHGGAVRCVAWPAAGAVPAQDGIDSSGLMHDVASGPSHSSSCIADVSAAASSRGVQAAVGYTRDTHQFASAYHRRTLPTGASMLLFFHTTGGSDERR